MCPNTEEQVQQVRPEPETGSRSQNNHTCIWAAHVITFLHSHVSMNADTGK